MKIEELRARRKYLYAENKKFQRGVFTEVPRSEWPESKAASRMTRCLRSRDFLVQVFVGEVTRLSICRTEIDIRGRFKDGITWDELMEIKRGIGYGSTDAVECFPADADVVNVANMRHLWIVPPSMTGFFWRKEADKSCHT